MVLEAHLLLCVTELDFNGFFCPKNGEYGPSMGFLDLLENLVINFF